MQPRCGRGAAEVRGAAERIARGAAEVQPRSSPRLRLGRAVLPRAHDRASRPLVAPESDSPRHRLDSLKELSSSRRGKRGPDRRRGAVGRDASRARRLEISARPRLHLGRASAAPRLHLGCISARPRLHLGCISARPRQVAPPKSTSRTADAVGISPAWRAEARPAAEGGDGGGCSREGRDPLEAGAVGILVPSEYSLPGRLGTGGGGFLSFSRASLGRLSAASRPPLGRLSAVSRPHLDPSATPRPHPRPHLGHLSAISRPYLRHRSATPGRLSAVSRPSLRRHLAGSAVEAKSTFSSLRSVCLREGS